MQELYNQIYATSPVEWAATLTALAYVYLAARDSQWCWGFAAISAILWAHQSLVAYGLVSDALLQLFYLVMAAVGLYKWQQTRRSPPEDDSLDSVAIVGEEPATDIRRMTVREHLLTIGGSVVVGLLLGYTVGSLANATQTYPDAITTTFSVAATFLLVWRRLENWLYWIVIDTVYVYIYYQSGALLFALLMILYVVMAGYGFLQWRRSTVHGGHQAAG